MFSRVYLAKLNTPILSFFSRNSSVLHDKLEKVIKAERVNVIEFIKKYGRTKVGEIHVEQVYGGMRGMLGLICETSLLDPAEGIRFRGLSIDECKKKLPKAEGGTEPLPEAVFWLLITGEVPTEEETTQISKEWGEQAVIPAYVQTMLKQFPKDLHPMSQFSAAITALNRESKFMKAYSEGKKKVEYWIFALEDAMSLIAKLPVVASMIYSNLYKGAKPVGPVSPDKDWSANLATMMNIEDPKFVEFLRLYLTIHSCHEGGNVSAHAVHLVGSALSDPFLSFAAGMNGLAGPLHGRATQEVLVFLNNMKSKLGESPTDDQMKKFIEETLKSGRVIPGYGHAVLRKTDPRFTFQRDFAEKNIKDDSVVKLVAQMFKIAPGVLQATGKVKNPWPNVDAHSGAILQHFGIKEMEFYTVLFGVSRSLGTMSSLVWSRALGLPIERPRSITTMEFKKLVLKLVENEKKLRSSGIKHKHHHHKHGGEKDGGKNVAGEKVAGEKQ